MSEAGDPRVIADNRRQVERLTRLGWYHSIELPDGGIIEGHQSVEQLRQRVQKFPLPDDLRGARVLDIGAWDGWFSFEMERRGADVTALDATPNTRLLQAREMLGSRVQHRIGDICRLTWRELGQFDIVLFLGVLYHVKHPILALENVCGMTRELACIESFVSDADPAAMPRMEFYETAELRGQLDNWVGPNASCLMAFCRTAGFARVHFEGALAERAHVSAYRKWSASAGAQPAPVVLCIENSATQDHHFSSLADDYLTVYFTSPDDDLNCDNVFVEAGPYGSRPVYVARNEGGWQVAAKLPPGLGQGWHDVKLRIKESAFSAPLRIGVDDPRIYESGASPVRITRVTDGRTFEDNLVRAGSGSSVSVWAAGLPSAAERQDIRLRLNGSDLPALWVAPPSGERTRQINALLPSGLGKGEAWLTVVVEGCESPRAALRIHRD